MIEGFRTIREELAVPASFPSEVEDEAARAASSGPQHVDGTAGAPRDARDLPLVTIDPPGSTDLDQAFAAETTPRGFRIHYAIADVAALVAPGGAIDAEARRRGLTLYSPDLRTSLHPVSINEGAGSLLEGQDRQALLWTIDLDDDGEIAAAHCERATVRSRARLSYRQAQTLIDSHQAEPSLALLRPIGGRRKDLERERGAVSLALPAQEVVAGPDGAFALEYDQTLPVEEWNAQVSLLTGIAASRIMLDAGVGILRTLPPPDDRTIRRLRRTARALGVGWDDSASYADRVRGLHPTSSREAAFLSQAARALRGAGYAAFHGHDLPAEPGHSAIASTYAHVTAPLRRLCDRFGNEVVIAACADRSPPSWAVEALDELPRQMGAAAQKDRALETAMVDFVEAVVLEPHVGERFAATVTDIDDERGRARVQLTEPAVVAHVPSEGLELGMAVQVRLDGTDPTARSVRFSAISE
ncbi:MAG: RNB domain-containing ribonuclease [Acidimicrobiales bacterium]